MVFEKSSDMNCTPKGCKVGTGPDALLRARVGNHNGPADETKAGNTVVPIPCLRSDEVSYLVLVPAEGSHESNTSDAARWPRDAALWRGAGPGGWCWRSGGRHPRGVRQRSRPESARRRRALRPQ